MIQFKRGSQKNWLSLSEPLADGQPGYDRDKKKIKIGNGRDLWKNLPYVGGLSTEDIFLADGDARDRNRADSEDKTLITYGTKVPDKNTIGQIYLQYCDNDPEVDYIVSSGTTDINNKGWSYQKWQSGIARCFRTIELSTSIQTPLGSALYQNNNSMQRLDYPFIFKEIPSETVSVQSPGGLVWHATAKNGLNTKTQTAIYNLISPDKLNNATYKISFQIEGRWK